MTKINMAALLAKARVADKAADKQEVIAEINAATPELNHLAKHKTTWISDIAIDPAKPGEDQSATMIVKAPAKPAAPAKLDLSTLRAKLKAAANKESARATTAAHADGSLPIDEEIVASVEVVDNEAAMLTPGASITTGMHGEAITYNSQQAEFISLISSGQSCVLIGAAGTGKTTCSQGGIAALIATGKVSPLAIEGHKHLLQGGPGIIIISYTRRAVNNIRKVQSTDMQGNCITSHKLLEYQPEYYELEDPETGETKKTMRFEPTRHASNPLPASITTIIVEEASMLSVELTSEITAALQHTVQWVFIGDIQQLPPVFGSAILGFKMIELPVVELIQVYRQALESPIIRLAHRILSGKPIPASEYPEWKEEGKLTLHPWKKKLSADHAALTLAAFFKAAIDNGVYNTEEDMILIPYNKSCGTIEINKHIANHLAKKRGVLTYEVVAGFLKHYFSAGDKILYDREDAEIVEITSNPSYSGGKFQPASKNLDYWGHNPKLAEERGSSSHNDYDAGDDVDFLLDQVAASDERVTQASHKLVIRLVDSGAEVTVNKASEVNSLLHAYALTVHKSQGSEWRKVFFCLHQTHATMLQRELLYTGVTRAREELYVICEPESFTKGIISQRIKGDTLAEKAEFFKGKLDKRMR